MFVDAPFSLLVVNGDVLFLLHVLLYCYDIIYCFKLISLSILFGVFVMLNGEFLTGQGVSRICNYNI